MNESSRELLARRTFPKPTPGATAETFRLSRALHDRSHACSLPMSTTYREEHG
jgi:hypothetical protein